MMLLIFLLDKLILQKESDMRFSMMTLLFLMSIYTLASSVNIVSFKARPAVNYPVRFVYIDQIKSWSSAQSIASGMGVPGYAPASIYNYIALAFWTDAKPDDIVSIWADPIKYMGATSVFGKTKDEIQKNLKKKYNDAGIKIMISVFGATQFPTTKGIDPTASATKLGAFVNANNLDGVDIDYQDFSAMEKGTAEQWVITFMKKLRELLPNHIITHAPVGPFFKKGLYKNGGYLTINQAVGSEIDFYNVQFYNQQTCRYDTYQTLFLSSTSPYTGSSVHQISNNGIPLKKIVVGKPANKKDADNTGWMDATILGQAVTKAYTDLKWYAGVMFWEYVSDTNGALISTAAGHLKELCQTNKDCK